MTAQEVYERGAAFYCVLHAGVLPEDSRRPEAIGGAERRTNLVWARRWIVAHCGEKVAR